MEILFGLLCIAIGMTLIFGGYRLARFIIPLWGFLTGLSIGGSIISSMSDTPFLGSVLGVLVGIFLGGVLAVFSYVYYAVAVYVLFGSLGYWIGSSFIMLFGFNEGFLSVMTGLAFGILGGILAIFMNAPKYVLVIVTALAGAIASIGGLVLMFSPNVTLDAFSFSGVHEAIKDSGLWSLLALGLMFAGILVQALTAAHYHELEEWAQGADQSPENQWPSTATNISHHF